MRQFLHVLIVKIWLTYKNDLWHVEKTSNSTGTLTVWVKIKRMNFCKILEESLCFALKVIFRLLWLFGRRNGRTLLQNLSNISKENIFLDESKIGALPGRLLDFLTAMATQKVSIIDTKENLQITKDCFWTSLCLCFLNLYSRFLKRTILFQALSLLNRLSLRPKKLNHRGS